MWSFVDRNFDTKNEDFFSQMALVPKFLCRTVRTQFFTERKQDYLAQVGKNYISGTLKREKKENQIPI